MPSPFDVFRKPHEVAVYGTSTLVDGIVMPGQIYLPDPPMFSVQRLGRNTTTELTAQGKNPTDYRRIYGSAWLPKEGEAVINSVVATPEPDDLILPSGEVIHFFGKHEFARQPLVNDQCPAARIKLEGWWCAVETRVTMQNGIVNNYEYLCYRLPADDQTI